MAVENITIARPYAEAIVDRARETGKLDLWSEMLGFLVEVVEDPRMAGLVLNPEIDHQTLEQLMLEIGGGRLSDEGQNLIRLLVLNRRLNVLPEISALYETLKNETEGTLDVEVTAPFPINQAQQEELARALKKRLGRDTKIISKQDPELIGGVRIRAGDLVFDGTVQGQLRQLATELGV